MNICFYNVTASYIPGGLETYCWEVGRALARRGHQVTIVAGAAGDAWHDEVAFLQFPFRMAESVPNFGTRFRRLMERLSFARHSLSHLVTAPYDAIIVNKPFDFPILWWARRQGMTAKTVFNSGGTDFFATDRWFANAIDHWVSASQYNARQVEERYGRPVTVTYNGVDIDRFQPRPRSIERRRAWQVPTAARVIVTVGRLVGWKGLSVIVRALPLLPNDVHYLVIGVGPEKQALEHLASELGVANRMRFLGRISHADLPDVLCEASLLLQPSIGVEAFGISVVEAMACGVPVLASNNGGMPEIVVEGETGRLLPRGDVEAWARAIADTLAGGEHLKTMSIAARARVEANFTWAANAAQVEQILLADKRACAA